MVGAGWFRRIESGHWVFGFDRRASPSFPSKHPNWVYFISKQDRGATIIALVPNLAAIPGMDIVSNALLAD
jgi:hypothetical protein